MLATIHMETHGTTQVARIVGEVDASNAADFTTQLKNVLPNSAYGLVLDLSETSYIDSSGVHMIFDLADALRRRQQVLGLVIPPDTFVSDVLTVVNVGGVAQTCPSLAAALSALKSPDF